MMYRCFGTTNPAMPWSKIVLAQDTQIGKGHGHIETRIASVSYDVDGCRKRIIGRACDWAKIVS